MLPLKVQSPSAARTAIIVVIIAVIIMVIVVIAIVIAIIQSSRIILGEEQRSLHYHNTSEIIMSRKPIKGFNGSLTGSAVGPAQLL